jgi:class 3 adenylate cyclase/tetratricopeptide (TPR) repeat protein
MLVLMTCDFCDHLLPEGAKFCPNCGSPVASSVGTQERKVVTVLFADLVDSTGLAQHLDAERTREVLGMFYDAATEELMALRGQPEKFIGDAVMAVFGLPQVHEDDAVRAVRAGLAIRDRTHRLGHELMLPDELEVRVGIESGEAATGTGPTGQLLVTGPVVNAAARIQVAAEPGEVLAGETTRQLTIRSVSFGEERLIQAKGFDTKLRTFPVEELSQRSARRTIPIVGRMVELSILRDSLARVVSTGRPYLFTLLGEPGVGKSRLGDEFVAGLGPETRAVIGRGQAYGDSQTFAPVAAMVRDLAGIDDGEPPDKAMRRLNDLVESAVEPPEVKRVASRLGLLLGLGEARRDESTFVQEVQSGFHALAEGLAVAAPLVLVFEDVHEQRPPLLDLIERLPGRAGSGAGKLLVLAIARPELIERRPGWGSGSANHTTVHLEPLSVSDATELALEASGGTVGESTAAAIAVRTGGNPFFIVETTGMLLRRDAPAGVVRPGQDAPLPPTVQAVVAARLDSLPLALRDFARRISVFLWSIDADDLGFIGEHSVDGLHQLEEEEILVRDESGSRMRWRFRHETLREVAYASLPKRERLRLHLSIADGLGTGQVSYAADHLERAALASLDLDPNDRTIPERAADALAMAGNRARRRMENRSALDYYERALAMAGPEESWGVREARVQAGMGESRYWLSEYPAAIDVLDSAVELGRAIEDDWTIALALRFRGDIALNIEGDLERAEELFDQSLAAAETLEESHAVSRTLLFSGWVPWSREDYPAAEAMWKRALEISVENDDDWARIRALTSLSIGRADQDDYEEARRLIEEAQEVALELGDQFSLAVTLVQRGRLLAYTEHAEEAVEHLTQAIGIFSDLGARWELADAMAERGIAYREQGQLDDAETDLQAAVRISEELGERQLASWTWRALARVSQKRGNRAEAEERLRRAEEEEARRPQ